MFAYSPKHWPLLAVAGCALLTAAGCAPNTTRTPLEPRLASAAEREDTRYGAILRMASSTRSGGDPSAAVTLYQQAVKLEPDRPEAYVLLGQTLVDLKAYDEAAQTFEEALDRDAGDLGAHRGYARAMLGLNRPESAIRHYQAVLAEAPDDLQARNGIGVAYDLAGQHEAAEAAYRAGLERTPDSMLLRNNLGLSLALAGQFDEAIEILRAVADEPGARARHRQNLALAYGLKGDLVAAERISRIDLDAEAVDNNLAYFAALAAVDDRRRRAAALGVHQPETNDDPDDVGARRRRAAALGVHQPETIDDPDDVGARRRLTAIALDGQGLELGLSPTGRWFLNLGRYADADRATVAWQRLRGEHADLLGNLSRLAGTQQGAQPLLVGPLSSAEEAQDVCGSLKLRGYQCRPLPL